MLTKYQEKALKWLRRCYFYIEEVPIAWDSKLKQISTNEQISKWIFWWIGNVFMFILWLTCVYTLSTQWIFQRKDLSILPFCILTSGFCCFSATLITAYGITKFRNKTYLSCANEYIALELKIYSEYKSEIFRKDIPVEKTDFIFVVGQLFNFLPFLIYIVCIFWNLDGPYWVIEDFASDPKYRTIPTILTFLLIRSFLLIPGFLETSRAIFYSSIGYLCVILYLKTIVETLEYKVNNQNDFFRYYDHICIITNVLGSGFNRANFLFCTIFYFLFVQTLWICVQGFGYLDLPIYIFFASFALLNVIAIAIYLPIVASAGEAINGVRERKLKECRSVYISLKNIDNKVNLKKAVALRTINFSYGSYYPLGKRFSRNCFDNMVQNLLTMVLMFDFSGEKTR